MYAIDGRVGRTMLTPLSTRQVEKRFAVANRQTWLIT